MSRLAEVGPRISFGMDPPTCDASLDLVHGGSLDVSFFHEVIVGLK